MELTHHLENNIIILAIGGELTESSTSELKKYFIPFLKDTMLKGILIDFKETSSIDSSGIGAIVSLFIEFKQQELPLALCQLNDDLLNHFQMLRLDHVLSIYPTLKEALEAFN